MIHYNSPNPPKKITPDLNEDGIINAAVVLRYAAYVGATELQAFLELENTAS